MSFGLPEIPAMAEFAGGEGLSSSIPSLYGGTIPNISTAAPAVTAMPGPTGGYTYEMLRGYDPSLPIDPFQGASMPAPGSGGGLPYQTPVPYSPPGGGYQAPPDVTVAGVVPGTTAAGVVTAGVPTGGYGWEVDEYGQVAQGGRDVATGRPAVQTAEPPAAAPETPPQDAQSWVTSPAGASYIAQQAVSGAGGPVTYDPNAGFLQRNFLGPFKQSGIGELLGVGLPAASLVRQLAQMPGGQTQLDPLQQQRLAMAQQQQNVAQQYLTGNVPASVQQNIQAQTQARIQQIRAKYAQLGMSGSTAESQDIAAAQAQGSRDLATASTQMVNAGAAMMNLPAQQLQSLTKEQLAQDEAFNNALAQFVAALSASPRQKTTA